MRKLMKALHTKKGFTLVECVIAIAVFAALTGMVLMIMSQTMQLSKKSSDAETDLNNLVENVVQDNSKKTYGADSKILDMTFDGQSDHFKMTYTTVDGYKNFIKCPDCGELANNTDYMGYIYDTTTYTSATDKSFKVCYWYDITNTETNELRCPHCYNASAGTGIITPSELRLYCLSCSECDTSDSKTSAGVYKFVYNKFTGGYTCSACGNGNVVQAVETTPGVYGPLTKVYASDTGLMISGMASNAIRYGDVGQFIDENDVKNLMTISTTSGNTPNFTTKWKYTPNKNVSVPGIYTLTLDVNGTIDSSETATVTIGLPTGYALTKCTGTTADGNGDHPLAVFRGKKDSYGNDTSILKISGIQSGHQHNIVVKFQLTNYENNNSFEEDYVNDGGLMTYWFQLSGNLNNGMERTISYPRTETVTGPTATPSKSTITTTTTTTTTTG